MNCRIALFVLVLFGGMVYVGGLSAPFQYDDFPAIVDMEVLRDLGNLPLIFNAARGLSLSTFALNYATGGLDPFGYRLVNVLLHLAVALLVYLVLDQTLPGEDAWRQRIAMFTALIFVVHPLHTQAVIYIVQRMEVLASFFYLLALFLFILAGKATNSNRRWLLLAAVFGCYLLGFKSKEIAVTLPAALLLYDYLFLAARSLREMRPRLPFHLLTWATCALLVIRTLEVLGGAPAKAAAASGAMPITVGFAVTGISPWEYLLTQSNVLLHYLSLILVPVHQNIDHDFPIFRSLFAVPDLPAGTVLNFILLPPIVALCLLAVLVTIAFWLGRQPVATPRLVSFCILMYFIVLSPTSSFVPVVDFMFEHRVYLASVFVILPLVLVLDWLGGRIFERKGKTVENRLASVLDDR